VIRLIISIFSPKGGVGKTTIALALADTLSKDRKVCVVEFDFSPGDFASTLNVDKNKNILRAIRQGISETTQKPKNKNFDVITGGYPDTHERISNDTLNKFIDDLSSVYDAVLFDIQPGLIENAITVLKRSDYAFAITEDTEAIKVRTARILQWLKDEHSLDFDKTKIILNKSKGRPKHVKDIISYTIPYFGENVTYENRGMRRNIQTIADMLEGKKIKHGLFSSPPKAVSSEQIETFVQETLKDFIPDDNDPLVSIKKEIKQSVSNDINEMPADIKQSIPANMNDKPIDIKEESVDRHTEYTSLREESLDSYTNIMTNLQKETLNKEENKMVYVKTSYDVIDDLIKEGLKTTDISLTDNFDECTVAVVSGISNGDIDKYVSSGKKIILLTDRQYVDYAKNKGIYSVLADVSAGDIIEEIKKAVNETENSVTPDIKQNDSIDNREDIKETSVIEDISKPIAKDMSKPEENISGYKKDNHEETVKSEAIVTDEIIEDNDIKSTAEITVDSANILSEINNIIKNYMSSMEKKIEEKYINEITTLKNKNHSLMKEIEEKDNALAKVEAELKERKKAAEQLKKLLTDM
jgi:MinD-like ATPase involved in chromosome partitioning or flagellar assembly